MQQAQIFPAVSGDRRGAHHRGYMTGDPALSAAALRAALLAEIATVRNSRHSPPLPAGIRQ